MSENNAEEFMEGAVQEANTEVNYTDDSDWDDIPLMEEAEAAESGEESEESSEEVEAEAEPVEEVVEEKEETKSEEPESDESESESKEEDSSEAFKIEDLKDDAKLQVKVDGEMQEISLKEFKSGISGQKALAQKWSEVDRVQKKNESDIKEINEYVNTFSSKMKEGNALSAMEYLGSFSGMGTHQIKAALIKSLMPDIERMYGMEQSEIDLEYQKSENEHLVQQRETNVKLAEQRQAEENLNAQISKVQDSLSIDDGEWSDAISYLDKHLEPEKVITPELVGEYVQFARSEKQADSILSGLDDGNLVSEEVRSALQQIIQDNPEFTKEDLEEIVNDSLGNAKKEVIEEKIGKQSKKVAKKSKQTKQEAQFSPITDSDGEEILSFEDL